MKMVILLVLLARLSLQLNQQQQSQPSTTSNLGILIRLSSSSSLDKLHAYLDNLGSQKCEIVSEFNLILSNTKSDDSVETLEKSLSTYKGTTIIHIYNVGFGEINFKFRIPNNSKADIYYVSDLQFNESCSDITQYYTQAKKVALAGLIPLIGEERMISTIRADLTSTSRVLTYQKITNNKHYTFTENIRLISRHFLELSQSNIGDISLMGNTMHPICQQIYINFIVAHFYPQLRPKFMVFKQHLQQSIDSIETEIKSVCIGQFIQILGYCPMYYQRINWNKTTWSNPNLDKIVQLKREQIERVILHENRNIQPINAQFSLPTPSTNIFPQAKTSSPQMILEQIIVLSLLSFITILLCGLRFVSSKVAVIQKQRLATLHFKQRNNDSQL